MPNGIPFNPQEPGGLEIARQIVFARLRADTGWKQMSQSGDGFDPYVEYVGPRDPDRLAFLALEVLWELIIAGVIAPGLNTSNPNLPWFHVTEYGRKVIGANRFVPHDPAGYLAELHREIPGIDSTVLAYLTESLQCFIRGTAVAATVMLGIAAERVFLLTCEALAPALRNPAEQTEFARKMSVMGIKPKLDFVLRKTMEIRANNPTLPDTLNITFATVFDFIRQQRNELGHPRDTPPAVTREEAFIYLHVFPTYYKTAETYRLFLQSHPGQL